MSSSTRRTDFLIRPGAIGRIKKSVLRVHDPMKRRGFTMLEMIVAAALLGTLLVVSLNMLGAAADWRRAADRRQLALFEAGNIMERIAARPWDQLTDEALADVRLPERIGRRLPGAELKIEVTDSPPTEKPASKRIAVSIRWRDRAGTLLPPVGLTTWRTKI